MAIPVLLWMTACGTAWNDADAAAMTGAARAEARQIDACSDPDTGRCTPEFVRASSALAYCMSARELVVHGAAVPDAGVKCLPQ